MKQANPNRWTCTERTRQGITRIMTRSLRKHGTPVTDEKNNLTIKHGITPRKFVVQRKSPSQKEEDDELAVAEEVSSKDAKKLAKQLEKEMIEAVRKLI